MVSMVRISFLAWASILADYAMWMMMPYLTDVWKISLTQAAAVVNVFNSAAAIMPIGMSFLVETFTGGDYCILLFSSVAYSIGLGLLAMSTPPVLSEALGTCGAYRPECIGNAQKVMFYTSLALVAVGSSGLITSAGSFMEQQLKTDISEDELGKTLLKILAACGVILFPLVGGIALPYIKPWSVRFGIPAICTLVATLLFFSGSCSYKYARREVSPLTTALRVFVASSSKILHSFPRDANQLYEKRQPDQHFLPHTHGIRCLDKAAIIVPNQNIEKQEQNRWKLCSVTEVEETKISVRMIPMWITFIMCGVVTSIGNTYFLEQANHMNHKVGRMKVPLPILLIFQDISKFIFTRFYAEVAKKSKVPEKYSPPIGIAVAMIFSILCCITAAKVETRRLGIIKSHGLLNKPKERIPMSMFWLLPQFLLLGTFDGIYKFSTNCFFTNQLPESMRSYLLIFTNAVSGAGILGSVLSVYIMSKISERGGKPSWFQDTLNKSRLDNYYWTLAAFSSVNLVLYTLVAICYTYQEPEKKNNEVVQYENSARPYDDDGICCSCTQ